MRYADPHARPAASPGANGRPLPFTLADGSTLTFNLPDEFLRLNEWIVSQSSGYINTDFAAAGGSRQKYLLNSLYEEPITSSQLEGASTTRRAAKEMLATGRKPATDSELMIHNNYLAMQLVSERRESPLTPEFVCEIHQMLTTGLLPDQECGKLQQPGDDRVRVYAGHTDEQVLHIPPPAGELPERLAQLCHFANTEADEHFIPPLARAIALHFMVGHDHYFVDGNGRLARTIFYWSLLHRGFYLTEYLSISKLLRKQPAEYARAFMHVELDHGDLTHFLLHQAKIVKRAIDELHDHLRQRASELDKISTILAGAYNHRQQALIKSLLRNPTVSLTVTGHQTYHQVSNQTARTDLQGLVDAGLLVASRDGKRHIWHAAPDFEHRLTRPNS